MAALVGTAEVQTVGQPLRALCGVCYGTCPCCARWQQAGEPKGLLAGLLIWGVDCLGTGGVAE